MAKRQTTDFKGICLGINDNKVAVCACGSDLTISLTQCIQAEVIISEKCAGFFVLFAG